VSKLLLDSSVLSRNSHSKKYRRYLQIKFIHLYPKTEEVFYHLLPDRDQDLKRLVFSFDRRTSLV
jgi:hypothetical protein